MVAKPIRIVPPRTQRVAPPAAPPRLTYRGGPLLTSVEPFLLFWGQAWSERQDLMERLSSFFHYVVTSPLIDQLSEYSVEDHPIGHGSRTRAIATRSSPPSTVNDADIRRFLAEELASDPAVAQPTPGSLYFVMLPPGVTAELEGATSCTGFCGYHNAIHRRLYYAVMPYPDCEGCSGGMTPFDALTMTSSHELCEAITDPVPGHGWYDDRNGEIADVCSWQVKELGGYAVQLEWSNEQGRCV